MPCLRPVTGDQILPPAIEARGPWNRGSVIRMAANRSTYWDPLVGDWCCLRLMIEYVPRFIPGNGWQGGQGLLGCYGSLTPIELKAKGVAEGGKSPLGGIGLGGLEGNVMHLAR